MSKPTSKAPDLRGAHTPEELQVLFEDACINRDLDAAVGLFADDAVWCADGSSGPVRGHDQIRRAAATMWTRGQTYVADSQSVLQAGSVALTVGDVLNVARRDADGVWRFVIALLDPYEERTHR